MLTKEDLPKSPVTSKDYSLMAVPWNVELFGEKESLLGDRLSNIVKNQQKQEDHLNPEPPADSEPKQEVPSISTPEGDKTEVLESKQTEEGKLADPQVEVTYNENEIEEIPSEITTVENKETVEEDNVVSEPVPNVAEAEATPPAVSAPTNPQIPSNFDSDNDEIEEIPSEIIDEEETKQETSLKETPSQPKNDIEEAKSTIETTNNETKTIEPTTFSSEDEIEEIPEAKDTPQEIKQNEEESKEESGEEAEEEEEEEEEGSTSTKKR